MTIRWRGLRGLCLLLLFASPLVAAGALILRAYLSPDPTLNGLDRLLVERRFDEAQGRIGAFLRRHPQSAQAHMLMAQACLAREDQMPRLALEHLARIRTGDRGTRATVLLNQGKAYSALGWNDRAEAAWKEALRIEPTAPEVGWDLLGLYYVQGRREEAHRLALAAYASEPDPRDRAQLLLELLRQDAQPIGPDSLIRTLEPLFRANPDDQHTTIALGAALVRNSRTDEGLAILFANSKRFAGDADAWDALLRGLEDAGHIDELAKSLSRVPAALAGDPRFERYRGAVLEHQRAWDRSADAFLRARRADPSDLRVLYRLSRVLRAAGRRADADRFDLMVKAAHQASERILPLYQEANAVKTLGVAPHRDLYHRVADLREQMGRYDEALAWHRLVLRDQPDEPISRHAISRLEAAIETNAGSHR